MAGKKILLTGYYGFGNLGDDLLFICNYNLLNQLYPNSIIKILTASQTPNYLSKVFNQSFFFTNDANLPDYDLIWHGGGGVFFDFSAGSYKQRVINRFIQIIGPNRFKKIYSFQRKLRKKTSYTNSNRIGMGIGVGSFTPDSPKLMKAILQMHDFKKLYVRDDVSLINAKKINPNISVEMTTDIVFDKSLWEKYIPNASNNKQQSRKKIGIILRDWKFKNAYNYLIDIFALADHLEKKKYEVTFFSFDKNTDLQFVKLATENKKKILIWLQGETDIHEYLTKISEQNYIIASRFHGAIIGAMLGVPGACLNIEPKLESAVKMLQNSYSLIDLPLSDPQIVVTDIISKINTSLFVQKPLADAITYNKQILLTTYKSLARE